MIEIKAHYWPDTPNLVELKLYVNNKLELSYFAEYLELTLMQESLDKMIKGMLSND